MFYDLISSQKSEAGEVVITMERKIKHLSSSRLSKITIIDREVWARFDWMEAGNICITNQELIENHVLEIM